MNIRMIGFVLADQFFINDVTERLKELGVEVRGFFSTSVGEAMQMIPFEERDHTAILVDVGYLSTEVMAVEGDALIWQKVLPVGGAHITLDLTYGLEKPFDRSAGRERPDGKLLRRTGQHDHRRTRG